MSNAFAIFAAADALRSAYAHSERNEPCAVGCFYRSFTSEQSSAIANIHLECVENAGYVEVIYHTNPNRAYGFDANQHFCTVLLNVISDPDLSPYGEKVSLGSLIAQAIKFGQMTKIPVAV